jgi:hypothetical protein
MMSTHSYKTDVLIVGGGVGGCAAALAVAESGFTVVMTDPTDWIGGQFTSQAVPPDEHGWIERFGCTRGYRRYREGVRAYYRSHYPLTDHARLSPLLNPGTGWVSPLCHEPRAALAVFEFLLAPYRSAGRVRILLKHEPIGVEKAGNDVLKAVQFSSLETGEECSVEAPFVIDASELGDLLPLSGAEFVTGFESQADTGEPSAPAEAQPNNNQAFSVCFALDHLEGEDHTIERPAKYDFWRSFVPEVDQPWPGKLMSWTAVNPRTMEPSHYKFNPNREPPNSWYGLWTFRRVLDRSNFEKGRFPSDVIIVNWPMNDYLLGDLLSADKEKQNQFIDEAKGQSFSLVHWLQTEAPRPDGGAGWPGLRLRDDVVGSSDGLAKYPYIRESRRIQAMFTVCEQHVSAACRPGKILAEQFEDSVGIGYYRIDLHPSTGGNNYIDVASCPFQIPLGALIPVRMENLLPACKNLGTTHITNGCYRLHPVEWNIGEAAGALTAFCLQKKMKPRQVYEDLAARKEFQSFMEDRGVQLAWPETLILEEGDAHGHAR